MSAIIEGATILSEDECEALVENIISARFTEGNFFEKEEFRTLALILSYQKARDLVIWEMCRLPKEERAYVLKTLELMTETVTPEEAPNAWCAYVVALWLNEQTADALIKAHLILMDHPQHIMTLLIGMSIQSKTHFEFFIETMNSLERDEVGAK